MGIGGGEGKRYDGIVWKLSMKWKYKGIRFRLMVAGIQLSWATFIVLCRAALEPGQVVKRDWPISRC
jgi:hypothetical protein